MFHQSAYPDHSRSGSAFATERNVDPQRPKTCLRPTQMRGQGARIFRAPGAFS
jgi:hypothetical protein